jgi:AcrR family transcriptional regulator
MSERTSSANLATLADRRNDLSRQLILDAAVDLIEETSVSKLTMRAAAKRANISERTVFRYFATRDEFLDAVAEAARARMDLPPPPRTIEELLAGPRPFYEALEAKRKLVLAGMHSELFDRFREAAARTRWTAIRKVIDEYAPGSGPVERKIAAANICYYLAASTWRYLRFYFPMSLDEGIACAETAIRLSIESLNVPLPPAPSAGRRRRDE